MNTEILFERKDHIIRKLDNPSEVFFEGIFKVGQASYASINAAKRESRRLQAIHGQGCLRVIS
jgi:hypothetical protein